MTAVETLLTFWPPGPLEREKTSSNSSGRKPRRRIRSAKSGNRLSTFEFKSRELEVQGRILKLECMGTDAAVESNGVARTLASRRVTSRLTVIPAPPYVSSALRPGALREIPFDMNIHEYQAKQLFERFNVATPKGAPAETPEEAEKIATALNGTELVVKAQIHAGGRGKGTFTNGFKAGVKLCKTPAEARELAKKMLGQTLVTHQTGPAGKIVRKVLVAASVDIERETYFAILMDRASGAPVVVASTEGGVEIEKVAEEHPEKIMREPVHPLLGLQPYQALEARPGTQFSGGPVKGRFQAVFESLQAVCLPRLFDGRNQSPGRHRQGRGPCARREIQFRRQRSLPAQRDSRDA